MKTAVYCGTRNLYPHMIPAIKSLMANSDVERIYVIAEDWKLPEELPDICKVIDITGQPYFKPTSPNWNNRCKYMVLIRIALPFILPDEDVVLSIDVDTIVRRDISSLWNIDLTNKYLAGVREIKKSINGYNYINNGVAFYNLKLLRESGKAQEMIDELNTVRYPDTEQDVINKFCQGKMAFFSAHYNSNPWTGIVKNPNIIHYAGRKEWFDEKDYLDYKSLSWHDVMMWRKLFYNL